MTYSTLRDAANARGVKFGGAVQRYSELADAGYAAIVNGETNAIKVGGDFFTLFGGEASDSMKMNGFHASAGSWAGDVWTPAFSWGPDAFATYARAHGLALHGHALIWYFATPDWLAAYEGNATKLKEIAKKHIQGVIQHYDANFSDVVYAWDVVNEPQGNQSAVGGNGWIWAGMYPGDPNPARWVEQCFLWAKEVARPGLKLFVNDYGIEYAGPKQDRMFNWLADALSRGVPIDGLGIQTHISALDGSKLVQWKATLARFASLGIEVHVAEMDAGFPRPATLDSSALATQAAVYGDFIQAAVETPSVTGVYLWNLANKYSYGDYQDPEFGWYMGDAGYGLWDAALAQKPAYTSVLDALNGRLTIAAGAVSGGATTVSGYRALGSTVAVSAPGATVGTVSYPTSTTWQAPLTGIAGTVTATATSGSETASVEVQGAPLATAMPVAPLGLAGRLPLLRGSLRPSAAALAMLGRAAQARGDLRLPAATTLSGRAPQLQGYLVLPAAEFGLRGREPVIVIPQPSGNVLVFLGGAWVEAEVLRHDGSAWVPAEAVLN